MKFLTNVLLFTTGVAAFPAALEAINGETEKRQVPGVEPGLSQTFDEKKQFISTTGRNKFIPPDFANGDQRGPCPGLNALANHGYLPRNGVGNILQYASATNAVYGLAYDIAYGFAIYGAFTSGDGLSWSMGGPPELGVSPTLPGFLGKPKGISFSHNEYEGDGSATRDDFYLGGNDYKLNMQYFKELYDILPADSFHTLSQHRNRRVEQSVKTNPYYFNGPFTGVAVAGGANAFVWRLAANHSKEYPQGYLSKDTFASFWGVSKKKNGELHWQPGWDRIPNNWYRRAHDDEYSVPFVAEDLATYYKDHPKSVRIGGNTGKTNSFVGVDVSNFTGGVFNAESLGSGGNLACLAFQAGALAIPDLLEPLFKDITGPVAEINKAFSKMLAPLNCPKLTKLNNEALKKYPGYTNPKKHQ